MNKLRITRAGPTIFVSLFALAIGSVYSASPLAAQTSAPPATKAKPAATATNQKWLTRPELTDYAETSRYDEVIAYMKMMAAANPQIHLTTYGYTYEGRPLPLAVIGAPGASVEEVMATKKTRVYVQGNIHAGEVEGKEALLW
ncbi:MAG: M14 family zinc carboxypeptidase, partial [Gemmatimonadaceae bacterium]